MKGMNLMKATARSIIVCALVPLLLTACGSSPPVRYFSLSSSVAAVGQDPEDSVALGFGPMRMPEYLNRSQLVTRGSGQEMEVDEFSRWAEPLSPAFHRIVSTDVDNAVDGLVVVAFPWESAVQAGVDYRLLGDVIRFDADRSGRVILDVQWGVLKVEPREFVVQPQRSRYEARTGSPGDPAAVASAMNDALAEFSRDIANEVEIALEK
jgi:uncharacterized lipoprotein YmbA